MAEPLRAAVLGATGFVGAELVRLLSRHPLLDVVAVLSERQAGKRLGQLVPGLRNSESGGLLLGKLRELPEVDVAFSCLASGVLPTLLSEVAHQAELVLNLAGDYRLRDPVERARHYPCSQPPEETASEYYVPEFRSPVEGSLVSLPGCMAAASIYALAPLFKNDLVRPEVVVDAKSGSSGSGLGATEHSALREGNVRVHRLHGHRHQAEVAEVVAGLTGRCPDLQFSVVSVPLGRGIYVSAYTRLLPGYGPRDVRAAYGAAYRDAPFVKIHNGRHAMSFPMLRSVVGTNLAELGASVERDRCVTVVALDNLVKGAAGQAVQAVNQISGWDEQLGLTEVAPWP